jgi:anti-sigma factor RsiW
MGDTMHDHHQCRQLFERLSEYIDNELDQVVCDRIENHLKQCEPCQACLQTLKQTVAICHEMKSTRVPQDFSNRLRSMLKAHAETI